MTAATPKGSGPKRRGGTLPSAPRLALCAVALALGAAGCTSARSNLGTSDNACYLALPAATKAVHASGKLLGVQRSTLPALEKEFPHFVGDLRLGGRPVHDVCLFAFTGRFAAPSVSRPRGRPEGRLAVVVLSTPSNALLGTVILRHPPLRFGHPHIG